MTGRLEVELVLDIAAFRILRAQKFSTRRQIVKNRADFYLGAGGFPAVSHRFDLASRDDDLRSGDCPRFARCQAKTRNAGNALGGLRPKPEVAMAARSAAVRSLLVAWRSNESKASSRSIPHPSSTTR